MLAKYGQVTLFLIGKKLPFYTILDHFRWTQFQKITDNFKILAKALPETLSFPALHQNWGRRTFLKLFHVRLSNYRLVRGQTILYQGMIFLPKDFKNNLEFNMFGGGGGRGTQTRI